MTKGEIILYTTEDDELEADSVVKDYLTAAADGKDYNVLVKGFAMYNEREAAV